MQADTFVNCFTCPDRGFDRPRFFPSHHSSSQACENEAVANTTARAKRAFFMTTSLLEKNYTAGKTAFFAASSHNAT